MKIPPHILRLLIGLAFALLRMLARRLGMSRPKPPKETHDGS